LLAVVSLGKYMFLDEPLVFAVQEGNIHEIRSLLERGASPNAEVKGTPALEQAAATGNERVVQILLHYGARTDVKNESNGHTALQSAQEYGYTTVAEILRTAGETK
jgi:ankyrin repeat protein